MARCRASAAPIVLLALCLAGGLSACAEKDASVLLEIGIPPEVSETVDAVRLDVRCGNERLFTRERLPKRGALPPAAELGNVMIEIGPLDCGIDIDVTGVRGAEETPVLTGHARVQALRGRVISARVWLRPLPGSPGPVVPVMPEPADGGLRDAEVADAGRDAPAARDLGTGSDAPTKADASTKSDVRPDAGSCSCNRPCRRCSNNSCTIITNAVDERTCSNGRMCDSTGECLRVDGRSCFSGRECASGHCVSGICCNTGCSAKGQSCKSGVCTLAQ